MGGLAPCVSKRVGGYDAVVSKGCGGLWVNVGHMSREEHVMRFQAIITIGIVGMLVAGCQGPAAWPRDFERTQNQVATSVTGQALWNNMAAHISGEGVQPGIEGYWITEQRVGSRLAGFAGQFNLSATGKGTESMPPELQQALIAQGMEDAALRARIVDWLTRPAGPEAAEGTSAAVPATTTQPAGP